MMETFKMEEDKKTETEAKINIVMSKKFKDMIDWLNLNYEDEIGGFITGKIDRTGIYIDDLLFPEQETSGASVDFSPKQLVGLRKEYGDRCLEIIGEWHSHNTMGAFWSITDDGFIESFSEKRPISVWIVSGKGEHLVRVEVREPFYLSVNRLGFVVKNDELKTEMEDMISKKVTKSKVVYSELTQQTLDKLNGVEYIENNILNQSDRIYRLNNTVRMWDVDEHTKEKIMKEFGVYNPKIIGKVMVFEFSDWNSSEMFYKEVKDYLCSVALAEEYEQASVEDMERAQFQ